MKTTKYFSLACLKIANSILGAYTAISDGAKEMTIESNVLMSDEMDNPPVNDKIQTILLKFSDELDPSTIADAVKLYRIDSTGNPVEEICAVKIDLNDPQTIRINNKDITRFAQGEEYQLVIKSTLGSKTKASLGCDYVGYFATNIDFDLSGNPELNEERSQIIIASDFHLGVDSAFAELEKNKQALVDFLGQVKNSPNVKELVIGGDLLDEWFLPMDYQMPDSKAAFFDQVAANNQAIVDGFNAIIKAGEIKVTYVPGNHDLLLTEADVARIFPGISQARAELQGLGTYVTGPNSEIVIEHGHKYNFFCTPDPLSNRAITNDNTTILPPGYFFTRIATTCVVEGHPQSDNVFPEMIPNKEDPSQFNAYLYYETWKAILSVLPVKESFEDKVLKTNIDGFTENYSINDCIPQQDKETGVISGVLYHNIQDTWEERQTINGIKAKIPVRDAITQAAVPAFTDYQAQTQFFDLDSSKRIVVFGHTHVADVIPMTNRNHQKNIYANSGTWIDNAQGYPTRTFVVITPPKGGSAIETVNLYQYSPDQTISQWTEAQAIRI
ncbi:metallophosphoesterase [Acetobacterium carbinolicum]|uniref:metallophosphoesterase n=1 Tax=Acetobacterium carbinolicum TaxID=52690 RepID=UPI0039C8E50F